MYDFAVVGAGIAGVAIAELLQRSGRSVLLLEAEDQVCRQSSSHQQGWFHTGALYAALPTRRYFRQLVGNLDDLLNYYGGFPDMNLASGRSLLTRSTEGWFRNSTNYYMYVSPADPSVKLWQKPLWQLAILRAQTRLSWFETVDFRRELSPQVSTLGLTTNLSRCLSKRSFDLDLGAIGKVMKSRDRAIDTERMVTDLVNAFLCAGGELRTKARVTYLEKNAVHLEDGSYRCRHIIVAAGCRIPEIAGVDLRVFKSPMLVVKPALSDVNFIRMTPNISETFNHLVHPSPEGDYSVIGNASYYDDRREIDVGALEAELLAQAESIFRCGIDRDRATLFFGRKAEIVNGRSLRNYQYQIVPGRNCVVAVPGKLSLAFSLAVNVCRYFGIDPVTEVAPLEDRGAASAVAPPEHYARFSALD